MENNKIALFQEKNIRREWIDEQWFFSVIDVIEILAETVKPSDYWYQLKKREKSYGIDLSIFCRKVKMLGLDGKKYPTDAANTEGLLRIIISIPSRNAEPFKLWLAQVGKERLEEIENPELTAQH